jgi:uncharacterized Zn-binding protein involved in type VI secretion
MVRDIQGREVARLGDTTDHGNRIVEEASDFTQIGIPVALDGHLTECPKCAGTFPIIATGTLTHKRKLVAYIGGQTASGAILLRR